MLKYCFTQKKRLGFKDVIVATNGSFIKNIDKKILKECTDYIKIAIDGYDESHSKFLRNDGSFTKSIEAIEYCRKNDIKSGFIATIHKNNYRNINNYLKLADKHRCEISFSILTCNPVDSKLRNYILDNDSLIELYKIYSEIKIDDFPNSEFSSISIKDNCGLCTKIISVDSTGNIYPCHFLQNNNLILGNILKKITYINQIEKYMPDECIICKYKNLCGGGCVARKYLQYGNFEEKDLYCRFYKYSYHKLEEKINSILDSKERRDK